MPFRLPLPGSVLSCFRYLSLTGLVALPYLSPAAGAAPAAEPAPLLLPLTAADLDLAACRAFIDGKPAAGETAPGPILGTLGLKGSDRAWSVGRRDEGQRRDYLLVFQKPLAVGAVLFQWHGTLKYLRKGAALPADPTVPADAWETVAFPPAQAGARLATLPPGTETQAFLCTLTAQNWHEWHPFELLRLFRPRLHNLVPDALANGEAEYTAFHDLGPPTPFFAANITRGAGAWQSHGPELQSKRIPRAPVSDVDPTWFVVSWDAPQALCGILLQSNFRKFQLLTYQGPPGMNPAVGGTGDWVKVKYTARDDGGRRWLTFPPLTTRGLKLLVIDAGGDRFGRIDGLQVLTDLQAAAVSARTVATQAAPCTVRYTMPFPGSVSLAIDDAAGRRMRNLAAREDRTAGEHTAGWDLKDESRRFVQPGTYRWKALANPGLQIKYEMTPYPNIEAHAPENSPWLNGSGGSGGWLADHTPPRAAAAAGDKIFFSAPCAESGVALIECDLNGHKLWGHHNIIAWTGPAYMASDGKALYTSPNTANDTDYVWRFTLPDNKLDTMLQLNATATRRRGVRGIVARDGKLYLSVSSGVNWFENAIAPQDVDLDNCEPRYSVPPKRGGSRLDDPDPRTDFLRLFRLTGTPPGCKGLISLETDNSATSRHHLVLAMGRPVPVGTLLFPFPTDRQLSVRFSALKADAPWPPRFRKESDWTVFWKGKGSGWTAIAAPENTTTRALRVSFDKGLDELDEVELGDEDKDKNAEGLTTDKADIGLGKTRWKAELDGMKILRRRFTNLFPTCKVQVSSGTVSAAGEWDAQRDRPLTRTNPGVYMMTWDQAQTVRGLAIEEIDGRFTEIDAWTGTGQPDLKADQGWEKLATYEQKLRYYYQPDENHNSSARYMDGCVDFGRDVQTRALRLRVVEQWMWKEDDRAGCVGVRKDRGGQELEPTRCRIYGVAPLAALGGEAAIDPLTTGRIEVYDTTTSKLLKEIAVDRPGDLALGPKGELYAAAGGGKILKLDLEGGQHTPLPVEVKEPWALACDRAGNLYVFDGARDQRVIKVFDPAGKALRTIGTPGGRIVGPWDPTRFGSSPGVAIDLEIDGRDQLWVVECDYNPKRISQWSLDGKFQKEFLGNTAYGGGGCLDRYDKSRLFFGALEFTLDWKSGATRLKNLTWLGDSPAGEYAIRVGDRQYLVTRPLFARQPVGVVYLYEKDRLRRVAAVGRAGSFDALRTPEILDKLGRKAIGDMAFAWSDTSGDGNPQPDEVEFFDLGEGRHQAGRFEDSLAIDFGTACRFEVKDFLPNGAPRYVRVPKAFRDQAEKLADGSFFLVGNDERMAAVAADGKTVWSHPAEGWGVHALYRAKPWFPGQVVAQFGVVGRETAVAGDLGEFFVTHTNTGAWHIWSADGLLAGRLFRDMRGPGARPWSMREHERGLDLSDVTVGQEHFNGYFCRTREDNRYYVVAGHNHVSVAEVQGLERIKRLGGELKVTPADIQSAITFDRQVQARRLYDAAKVFECRRIKEKIKVDGDPADWDFESARLADRDVTLSLAYDDTTLYLCYRARECGPLKNTGNDWKRLFKTGAAVDLQLGTDVAAPADRKDPVAGDLRVLMTLVKGEPVAVLYQPVYPGAKPDEAWEAHTSVFKATFDRVVRLGGVQLAASDTRDNDGTFRGYCIEAALPLAELGLKIQPDTRLKLDWGVLVSGPDGSETFQRLYWANPQTAIVSDEAAEAMLHPDLWGYVRFSGKIGKEGLESALDVEKTMKTETQGTESGMGLEE